jgi:hypothetical protein
MIGVHVYIHLDSIGHRLNACSQDNFAAFRHFWFTGVDLWRPAENRLLSSLVPTNGHE